MPETSAQQLVVFSLAGEEYALPIGAVHEIIRFTEPRSVASEVDWIRGVIGLRVTGIVLGVTGELIATVLLLVPPADAGRLVTILGVDPADELAASALGEIGNVVGTSYLNGSPA
jgi:purine-binding chemotaxis protein CheW